MQKSSAGAVIRLYDLRHSCATLLLPAGENPKMVSERLGHASAQLALDLHSHVIPDMQARAAERLEMLPYGQRAERHTMGTPEADG